MRSVIPFEECLGVSTTLVGQEGLADEYRFDFEFSGIEGAKETLASVSGINLSCIKVVWNRRPQRLRPPPTISMADKNFARLELNTAYRSMIEFLGHAFWVNPWRSAHLAELKPLQLKLAIESSLIIPHTLISNRPSQIRKFLAAHKNAIFKPLNGYVWKSEGGEAATYTSKIELESLPQDEFLRAAPGIFQRKVEKSFEVRAQFFGASCFAAKIESKRLEYGEFDWRLNQQDIADVAEISLPQDIYSGCIRLMKKLGIVMGAFDFIVDDVGNWIFLEVNQSGQFLFLEEWCPLPVLDAFCKFLISQDAEFVYASDDSPVTLSEVN